MLKLSILLFSLFSLRAMAYPDFIGYGYRSCLTCHFNGHGNGPLNDYGRALFATEIASRWYFPAQMEEDEIASKNGFLGDKELPWWWRPGVKLRGLFMTDSFGTRESKSRFIPMQVDFNSAIFIDPDEKLAVIGTIGYMPKPSRFKTSNEKPPPSLISREYYLRWNVNKSLWVYTGFMDKVFGIRQIDHTAYSRSKTGLAQNDQTHGVTLHFIQKTFEHTLQFFAGNLGQEKELRQQGLSYMTEYEVAEKWTAGASLMKSKNDFVDRTLVALHSRAATQSPGSSVMAEVGYIQDRPTVATQANKSYYSMLQSTTHLSRGYNFISTFQNYKADITTASAETIKWSGGLLAFPLPKTEFRLNLVDTRSLTPGQGGEDQWSLQSQVHLSW